MHNLERFGLQEMIAAGKTLRVLGEGAASMEEAARAMVDFFYESFRTAGQGASCVLVRCFKTHAYGVLPEELRRRVEARERVAAEVRCLTLLASRGEEPRWNGRAGSVGHAVIPLPTKEIVERAPMIARLIQQMGLKIEQVVRPQDGLLVDSEQVSFNVFHVEEALGSEFVPAQAGFVERYGVRSVLGFGGLLPGNELFAVVMFTRVRVPRQTAEMFRTLALGAKLVLLPFAGGRVFEAQGPGARVPGSASGGGR